MLIVDWTRIIGHPVLCFRNEGKMAECEYEVGLL